MGHVAQAIALCPGSSQAYILQGKILAQMGRAAEAKDAWRRAVESSKSKAVADLTLIMDIVKGQSSDSGVSSHRTVSPRAATIADLHKKFVGGTDARLSGQVLELARRSLANASGERLVDELIAVGYLHVNTGNLQLATEIFSSLNEVHGDLVACHLGLGSSQALQGKFDEAINSFSEAISIDPTVADAFKRRGQTRAAKDLLRDAAQDLTRAAELAPGDGDTLVQRGMVFSKMRLFQRALADFLLAAELDEDSAALHNSIGMAHGQLGNLQESLDAYDRALQREPGFVEALLNKGRIAKEGGLLELAIHCFEQALRLDIDRRFPQALQFRAQLHYAAGSPLLCIADLQTYLARVPGDVECLTLLGLSLQSLGNYRSAIEVYECVLKVSGGSYVWYLRQVALFYWQHLDADFILLSPDTHIDPRIKDGLCKRNDWRATMLEYRDPSIPSLECGESSYLCPVPSEVIATADRRSLVVQLQCPGFLPNSRQRRMFGLASLQCAYHLRNNSSLDWRSLFDVAVRWRQVSEPNDCVYWIDGFPCAAFQEGFGLTTPIQNGELKTFRYYVYFEKCLEVVKQILVNSRGEHYSASAQLLRLPADKLALVGEITSLDQLYSLVGQDFYVITRCFHSLLADSAEGTRITLLKSVVAGYEFTIRTPGTPDRWKWYDIALTATFKEVISSIQNGSAQKVRNAALELFYYYVNFAPLSRGSAVTAYAVLNSILLANGSFISSPIPRGVQLDWEAILACSKEEFVAFADECLTTSSHDDDGSILNSSKIRTYRNMVAALNISL